MSKREELLAHHRHRLTQMMQRHQQEITDLIAAQHLELAELMIHEDDPQRALDVLNIVKAPLQYEVKNGNPQLADTQDAKCLVHVIDRTMEHITKKYRM
ncbi:Uncharacterised protein [Escherichia coli]|uniref:hypothetical protein n=1 Tax=Escherichia coli TaxID=562 RepID=UPI001EF61DA0|nr:hypothetical protein [Escherichia coli]CAB5619693.1 Uncharacterised protein [Escherichia coli]CAC9204575.1 Uncharacterised protein [Escherichia coli]